MGTTGNIIDRLMWLAGYVKEDAALKALGDIPAPGWALANLNSSTGAVDMTVVENQLSAHQKLSWVYSAATARVQSAAGTPLNVKERTGKDQKDIDNHPFELLLEHPNPLQSRFEFLSAWFGYRLLAGNAYVWMNRTSPLEPPSELWLIPPHRIRPIPDNRLYIKEYRYDPGNGQEIPLAVWEICHTKTWHPTNPFIGLSAIEALALTVESDIAMQKYNRNYFGKQNAKPPGALAFADFIRNQDWARMKEDIEKEHGGVERRMMMLRGAGKGGVQWLQFGLSQKDMDFLNSRTFSKEEIYSVLAPGLASVLAVNATEANALAGDKTFTRMAIWPDHVAVAEKITSDILPAYGENLRCEFDDVRVVDRSMELKEQEAYAKVHKIDEIRKEYYGDPPIGDERGEKLPAEISAGSNFGAPPIPPDDGTEKVPSNPAEDEQAKSLDGQDKEKPKGKDEEYAPKDAEGPDSALKAELLRWQKKSLKRVKARGSGECSFESELIDEAMKGYIERGLVDASSSEEVRQVFDGAMKARARRASNAPDDYVRRKAERELAETMAEYFRGQMKRATKVVKNAGTA